MSGTSLYPTYRARWPAMPSPNSVLRDATWNGGWRRRNNGKIEPKQGGRLKILANIFANPDLPGIDDYYEPWDYDYAHLHTAPESKAMPTARPRSAISGERMEKIEWGPNWEEILGAEFAKRSKDTNFDGVQKEIYGQFEHTFMMYLPCLCEHCLSPACVASCPSGALYKREEGIHLSRDALQAEPVGAVREPPLRGFPSSAGILPAVDWRRMP